MTTNYMENESSKKKYLAPLVVIMLCAVALTGAAYAAYATSVTGNGDIAGKYVVLDIYDSGGTKEQTDIPLAGTSKQIKVYTTTDKTANVEDKKYYVANLDKTTITFETYVKINTDIVDKTFTLSVGLGDYTPGTNAGDLTISNIGNLTIYNTGDNTDQTSNPISGKTLYRITFTCDVVGGTSSEAESGVFGSYDGLDAVSAAVAAIDSGTLKIILNAVEST